MQINGVELEFDYTEEQTNKRLEKGMRKVAEETKNADQEKKLSKQTVIVCSAVKSFFDFMFGSGVGEAVCGKENSLRKCIIAYRELINEISKQHSELMQMLKELNSTDLEEWTE